MLLINSSVYGDSRFTDPIVKILDDMRIEYSIRHWSDLTGKKQIEKYSGVIISASPRGNNANFNERLESFHWLKTFENPVFGICAGHQLTGVTFGASLISNSEAEEGEVDIVVKTGDPVFKGLSRTFKGVQHHNDSITLPQECVLMASSKKCKVQAVKHQSRPIYTFQWHVEISNPEIIRNFLKVERLGGG